MMTQHRVRVRGWAHPGLWAALLLCASACASSAIRVESQGRNLLAASDYQTYALLTHRVGRIPSADPAIKSTIRTAMQDRGYRFAETGADLFVSYKVLLADESQDDKGAIQAQAAAAGNAEDALFAAEASNDAVSKDKVILVILQDSKTAEMVWVGWSRTKVGAKDMAESISMAVDMILEELPPRPSDEA